MELIHYLSRQFDLPVKNVPAQHPEAQGPKQHEVRQLADGHALQDSSDSNQHKLGCAIYPDRAWSETYLTEDSLASQSFRT